jgi:hypothetical protein
MRFTLVLSLALAGGLSGCAHRLHGPDYSAEMPPFIGGLAAGQTQAIAPFELQHRVILIGDAGYFLEDDPTLAALDAWATDVDSSSVIFLGDNIYNDGLTDEDREAGERIIRQQLEATEALKIFIPGNHDWGFLPRNQNAIAIRNQQTYIDEWPAGQAEFIPRDGCMGPVRRVLSPATMTHPAVVFIAMDPTPWINERLREDCPTPQTTNELLAALESRLIEHRDDFVIVGSHYPMLTGGPHGGLSYGWLADMIVTPLGWMVGGLANTYEPGYADWIAQTQAVLRRNPPTIYAAGHDHNLQILEAGDVAGLYVVSGAGARDRVSTVTNLEQTIFAHAAPGFVVVDFGERYGARVVVLHVIEAGAEAPTFEMEMR